MGVTAKTAVQTATLLPPPFIDPVSGNRMLRTVESPRDTKDAPSHAMPMNILQAETLYLIGSLAHRLIGKIHHPSSASGFVCTVNFIKKMGKTG
jgi:hypothetical protein